MKIMVPKEYIYLSPTQKLEFSMLGLGDIVVPGLFIALALRYDLYRYHLNNPTFQYKRHFYRFPQPFFKATFIAYILGLITTMTVMHVFKAAQPALLYLSPSCAAAAFLTALVRRELPSLWAYKEISKEERLEQLKEEKKKEEDTADGDNKVDGEVKRTDDGVKHQTQAIKKKIPGPSPPSGHGGDVESLDETAEDGEAADSEWTQGPEGPEVLLFAIINAVE
jgi:minor histocompatibility antigen H13